MQKEERDLREVRDTLRMALAVCDMRLTRTGEMLSVGEIARLGIEILYEGEREMLRVRQEKVVFDVEVVPQSL